MTDLVARLPCEHGRYEAHWVSKYNYSYPRDGTTCPGGRAIKLKRQGENRMAIVSEEKP